MSAEEGSCMGGVCTVHSQRNRQEMSQRRSCDRWLTVCSLFWLVPAFDYTDSDTSIYTVCSIIAFTALLDIDFCVTQFAKHDSMDSEGR